MIAVHGPTALATSDTRSAVKKSKAGGWWPHTRLSRLRWMLYRIFLSQGQTIEDMIYQFRRQMFNFFLSFLLVAEALDFQG